jgi:predicted kinase
MAAMEMILFVGAPGVGKSTFFHLHFRETHIRINLDMLRTRHREKGLIDACLAFKQGFVVDNTNPTTADRANYIAKARAAGFSVVCYFFDAPIETMIARNALRAGKARVPDAAIRATRRKLERPCRAEGFDTVYRVVPQENEAFEITDITDEI